MATIASFLEHKTYVESNKLKHKLRNQLYKDIYKLYSESIFADIYINVENNVIKSHRCILQARVPAFYNTYANRPDLINYVPVSELGLFFQEIYKESEIGQREEEILKYIDSCFAQNNSSASTSTSEHEGVDSKQRLLQDLSKVNALNATHVSRLYFRSNNDNSVYYSLVDRSLVLSDYSDINEETSDMSMSGCPEQAKTPTRTEPDTSDALVQEKASCPIEQSRSKPKPKEQSKNFKCFIDASDLIDEGDVESVDVSLKSITAERPCDSLNGDSEITSSEKLSIVVDENDDVSKCEKRKSSKLVEEHDRKRAASDQVVVSSSCYEQPKVDSSSFSKPIDLTDDTVARITEPRSPDTTSSANKSCSQRTRESAESSSAPAFSEMVSSTECDPDTVERELFSRFKSHLKVKYECARSNHTYTDAEQNRLKAFDQLLANDSQFRYLKLHLEETLSLEPPSKTQVAVHKFLVKQYEKKHGVEETSANAKSMMWDLLKSRSSSTDVVDGADNDDLFKKLLSSKPAVVVESKTATTSKKFEPLRESVTNSKSCGFFIDLKDNGKPVAPVPESKEKSPLPPKQLFSMFIDFGNSTDSDSSLEAQSKFERRKKQYMSKMEKSRGGDLRTSVTSLNDVFGAADTKTVSSAAAVDVPEPVKVDASVVRRGKSQTTSSKLNEMRRSWNVDKTNELNLSTTMSTTRHKRSVSVVERNIDLLGSVKAAECARGAPPSIGNADSTNELTVNGESEISTSVSRSEVETTDREPLSTSLMCETPATSLENDPSNKDRGEEKTFVRLSDLDNEPKSLTSTGPWPSLRMTKSVTGVESNWLETRLLNNSTNSRSLSRIFPDLNASILSKTNSDVDDTTVSSISSVQSSSVVSTCESNLELSSLTNKADNHTLGHDLLRMLLDEISTDVVVEVAGRRIKAHKCILTSRCQYFAALLSGGWVESAGNVLSILGFSYNVVHFALRYIYSGESEIPDNINIVELATLADYLCLEGLKEIVSSTLKTKYCHFFHKPCNVCSVGVLECLPIAINYGLDDLHRKSLRWISKHYVRLWCTKAFASLPWDLIDKCFNQHIVNMTVDNVFETLMNCDKLFSVIPQTRWAEPCFVVTKKLHDSCIKYLSNHFVEFLKSDSFTSIASNRTWGIVIMDEKAQHVCAKMRTDSLCQSYAYISEQHKLATATHENEELIELLSRVKNQIETSLVKTALQASQSSAWFQMGPELRSHIQTSAGLTFIPTEAKRRSEALKPRQSLVASSGSRTVDLAQVKSAINRQHRQNNVRTSEPRESRTSAHQRQASIPPRSSSNRQNGVQNKENKAHCNSMSGSSRSPYRNKYANVKSRYMDRKNDKDEKNVSETTPSETSEAEKSSVTSKRSSKSLVSSVHLSPAIRQTARAVSLSKIPVSVRNSSRIRNESDKDTTSGSDSGAAARNNRRKVNGVGSEAGATSARNAKKTPTSERGGHGSSSSAAAAQSASMRRSHSGSERTTRNLDERSSSSRATSRSYTKTTQSASAKMRTSMMANGTTTTRSVSNVGKENGHVRRASVTRERSAVASVSTKTTTTTTTRTNSSSKDSSPDTKCPSDQSSKNSLSDDAMVEELPRRPDIPFRRDGTFCIDEPTMLKKRIATSDHADIV